MTSIRGVVPASRSEPSQTGSPKQAINPLPKAHSLLGSAPRLYANSDSSLQAVDGAPRITIDLHLTPAGALIRQADALSDQVNRLALDAATQGELRPDEAQQALAEIGATVDKITAQADALAGAAPEPEAALRQYAQTIRLNIDLLNQQLSDGSTVTSQQIFDLALDAQMLAVTSRLSTMDLSDPAVAQQVQEIDSWVGNARDVNAGTGEVQTIKERALVFLGMLKSSVLARQLDDATATAEPPEGPPGGLSDDEWTSLFEQTMRKADGPAAFFTTGDNGITPALAQLLANAPR